MEKITKAICVENSAKQYTKRKKCCFGLSNSQALQTAQKYLIKTATSCTG